MNPSDFNYCTTFDFWAVDAFLDFCYKRKLTPENSLVVENEDGSRTIYFNS